MADDELSAPLGQNAKKKRRRFTLPVRVPHVDRGRARRCSLLVCAVWALVVDDPLGGEPIAVVATGFDRAEAGRQPASPGGAATQGPRSYDGPGTPGRSSCRSGADRRRRPASADAPAPSSKTVTIIDGSTGKRQEVADPGVARRPRAARAAPARDTRHGAHPAHRARRRAAGRSLRPRRQAAAGPQGRRRGSRSWSAGSASAPPPPSRRSQKLPGAGDLRVRALRRRRRAPGRRARAPTATRCCCRRRWSRSTIPTTIPARRRC